MKYRVLKTILVTVSLLSGMLVYASNFNISCLVLNNDNTYAIKVDIIDLSSEGYTYLLFTYPSTFSEEEIHYKSDITNNNTYTFENVSPGKYTVVVSDRNNLVSSKTIEVGEVE